MTDHFSRLRDLNSQFGFLLNTKSLLLQQVPAAVDDVDTELRSQCLHFDKITRMHGSALRCVRSHSRSIWNMANLRIVSRRGVSLNILPDTRNF